MEHLKNAERKKGNLESYTKLKRKIVLEKPRRGTDIFSQRARRAHCTLTSRLRRVSLPLGAVGSACWDGPGSPKRCGAGQPQAGAHALAATLEVLTKAQGNRRAVQLLGVHQTHTCTRGAYGRCVYHHHTGDTEAPSGRRTEQRHSPFQKTHSYSARRSEQRSHEQPRRNLKHTERGKKPAWRGHLLREEETRGQQTPPLKH